ncbi:phospholipid-binding protein MlaC [Pokkaliibacter sp. CJK22405]|uniref:MlaC/ttg2D family ABC transporter substrate-binding protein n=1 Tax=Pokkaliibacter sp. CJK22405 TaxID=3384615 RepID=UPI003985388F
MIKQIARLFWVSLMMSVLALSTAARADDWSEAKEVVSTTTDSMLALMKDASMRNPDNLDKLYAEVETTVTPVVDFESLSRGVMAFYYRQASDAQRAAFQEQFKKTVIRTFAKALQVIELDKYTVQPSQDGAGSDGKTSVTVDLTTSKGTTYRMQYSLHKKDGQWLIYNVVLDGVNVGLNFRNQFAEAMNREGNLDKVIQNWSVSSDAVKK